LEKTMQATLETTRVIETADQPHARADESAAIEAADELRTLAPAQLAYVGGGTGAISNF
jgi:hypothetical protein